MPTLTPPASPPAPATKPAKKMSMALVNLLLDATLFANVIFVVWVSIMMQVIFPPPTLADGWRLWGLTFDQWRDAQFYALCLFAVIAVEHVVLHWNWVCCAIATHVLRVRNKPDEGTQAVYGVGTFIAIAVLSLALLLAALATVQKPL